MSRAGDAAFADAIRGLITDEHREAFRQLSDALGGPAAVISLVGVFTTDLAVLTATADEEANE